MKPFFTKKRVVAGVIVLVVLLAGAGIVYAADTWNQITTNQMDLFDQSFAPLPEETPSQAPSPSDTASPSGETPDVTASPSGEPSPTPTTNPDDDVANQADQSLMKDTLNVLLIGVDYADERVNNPNAYQGKNFNSDVMLLLAINFKQNKVDMISFPRDTYAKIPNVNSTTPNSFYKLNFSLTAGGGMNDRGFMNVCKSVEGILGDKRIPPVNYYVAVNMESMKKLTDAIGGVDYNVDINFKIQGREYKKGMQHLDGQGVLDYCRVRKNGVDGYISEAPGDLNRVNRQKKMLISVFKKLQSQSLLLSVPKIVTSMQGEVFTNMNFKQLAALALFGKNLPENKITMRTLPNHGTEGLFVGWAMVLQDQSKRIAMLKDVYGVGNVAPQYRYDAEFARLLWAWLQGQGWTEEIDKWMLVDDARRAYLQGDGWLKEVNEWIATDAAKPSDQQKLTNAEDYTKLKSLADATKKLLAKYRDKLFGSKPSATTAIANELAAQAARLKDFAAPMFANAGFAADWNLTAPEYLRLIAPGDKTQLDTMVGATKRLMNQYHDRLYKDAKPVVSTAEWQEMSTQVTHMKDLAARLFSKAGYKPDWGIGVPEVIDMKE